jgi:hypothetical protein
MLVDLYHTGDDTFQADFDTPDGSLSFEFRHRRVLVSLIDCYPKNGETRAKARDALAADELESIRDRYGYEQELPAVLRDALAAIAKARGTP